jgi:hypothetical protein
VTAILPDLSPCRRHPCSLEHADVVTGFREHAARWEAEAERETGGYETDLVRYALDHPRPLFRDWLIHQRRAS